MYFLDASATLQIKVGDRVKGGASVLAHTGSRARDNWRRQRGTRPRSAVMEHEVP